MDHWYSVRTDRTSFSFFTVVSLPTMEHYAVQRLMNIFKNYDETLTHEQCLLLSETIINALIIKTQTVPLFRQAFWKILWNLHLKGPERAKATLNDLFSNKWPTIDEFINATDDELDTTCDEFRTNIRKRDFERMEHTKRLNASLNNEQTETTQNKPNGLLCPRCKSNNTEYNLFQTRSGDESSTAFVYCTQCHKRWRFC